MTTPRYTLLARLLAAALLLGLGSCEKRDASKSPTATDLLSQIPADSPFVLISTEPVPRSFTDWLGRGLAPLAELAQASLDKVKLEEKDPLGRALVNELDGNLSRAGFESMGLSFEPRFAIYAIGLSLAIRVELKSGARFEALISRLEQASGKAMRKHAFVGVTYREVINDNGALVLAVHDDELIVGIMHKNARQTVLPVLFGKTPPDKSMADTKLIQHLRDRYKLTGVSLAYVDSQAIVRLLTGEASALTRQTIADSEADFSALSTTCRREFAELAAITPRAVFGYREITGRQTTSLVAVELREDLAGHLSGLRTAGLDLTSLKGGDALMSLGINLDIGRAVAWLNDRAAAVWTQPYLCEHLRELNESMDDLRRDLAEPPPALIGNFKGAAFVVHSFDPTGLIPSGTGYGTVALDNVSAAVAFAKASVPMLSHLDATPGGVSQKLPLGPLGNGQLIVRDDVIGASLGPGMDGKLSKLMSSKSGPDGPIAVMTYDYGRAIKLSRNLDLSDPVQARLATALSQIFGYATYELQFTQHGAVLTSRSRMP